MARCQNLVYTLCQVKRFTLFQLALKAEHMNILVIEDNADLRRLYVKSLVHRKHQVSEAGSIADAFTALDSAAPDLVVVDMELPDGSGRSIIDRIRRDGRFKHTRLVAVSGNNKYNRVEAGNFGADMFLLKPVSIRMVQALLDLTSDMPAQ